MAAEFAVHPFETLIDYRALQLASNQDQLARKQDQMTQAFATLQAAVRDINQNILALAPLAPKAAHVPPPNPP